MELVTPDLELILPGRVFDRLKTKYARLFTSRAAPADLGGRPVVVLHQEGGLSKNRLLDQVRIAVDVYAATESQANSLALDARAVLEAQQGHDPVISIETTGPSVITDSGKGPQRRFYADVLTRRKVL